MQIKYDEYTDILVVKLTDKKSVESEHLIKEGIIIDYDENNNVIGLEIRDLPKKLCNQSNKFSSPNLTFKICLIS